MKQIITFSAENDADFYAMCSKFTVEDINRASKLAFEKLLDYITDVSGDNGVKYNVLKVETFPNGVLN